MNNKGISLIEVIVVVAILSIMSSMLVMSYNVVYQQKTKSCAESIDSYLDRIRLESMSREKQRYMVLYQAEDGMYMGATSDPDSFVKDTKREEKVGDKSVSIYYKTASSGTYTKISGETMFMISFDRVTGGFDKEYTTKEEIECLNIALGESTNGNEIRFITKTGKHFIE